MTTTTGQYLWPSHDVPQPKTKIKPAATRQRASAVNAAAAAQPPTPAAPEAPVQQQGRTEAQAGRENRVEAQSQPPPAAHLPAMGATRKKPVIASLAKPPSKPERTRTRGSLSEQVFVNCKKSAFIFASGVESKASKSNVCAASSLPTFRRSRTS